MPKYKEIDTVQVKGLDELTRTLTTNLPAEAGQKLVRRVMRRSFKPMMQTAKRKASTGQKTISSGALSASIAIWNEKVRKRGQTVVRLRIGPRRSDRSAFIQYMEFYGRKLTPKNANSGIRHGHFVEFGVPERKIPARPFLRPAFNQHGYSGIRAFRVDYFKSVDRAVIKARKKSEGGG